MKHPILRIDTTNYCHVTSSWNGSKDYMDKLKEYYNIYDWTSDEHMKLDKLKQINKINESIDWSPTFIIIWDEEFEKCGGLRASVAQMWKAIFYKWKKNVVIIDPFLNTREAHPKTKSKLIPPLSNNLYHKLPECNNYNIKCFETLDDFLNGKKKLNDKE